MLCIEKCGIEIELECHVNTRTVMNSVLQAAKEFAKNSNLLQNNKNIQKYIVNSKIHSKSTNTMQ